MLRMSLVEPIGIGDSHDGCTALVSHYHDLVPLLRARVFSGNKRKLKGVHFFSCVGSSICSLQISVLSPFPVFSKGWLVLLLGVGPPKMPRFGFSFGFLHGRRKDA